MSTSIRPYYDQKPAPVPESEAEILVIQADGKGVPLILEAAQADKVRLGKGEKRGRKKEALVTSVYSIAPAFRTPDQVIASYYDQISLSQPAVSPHLNVVKLPIGEPIEARQSKVYRAVWGFPTGMAEP